MKRTLKHKNPASVAIRIAAGSQPARSRSGGPTITRPANVAIRISAGSQPDPNCSWIAARLKQKRRSKHQKTGQYRYLNCQQRRVLPSVKQNWKHQKTGQNQFSIIFVSIRRELPSLVFPGKKNRSFCFRNIDTLRWSHKRSQTDRTKPDRQEEPRQEKHAGATEFGPLPHICFALFQWNFARIWWDTRLRTVRRWDGVTQMYQGNKVQTFVQSKECLVWCNKKYFIEAYRGSTSLCTYSRQVFPRIHVGGRSIPKAKR